MTRSNSITPCWAVLAAFADRLDVPWDGAFVSGSPCRGSRGTVRNPPARGRLLGAARESGVVGDAPGRGAGGVRLRGRAGASGDGFSRRTPVALQSGYRNPGAVLFDDEAGIVVCSNWLAGGRVEGAFLSGTAAAGCVLREVGIPGSPGAA